METWDAIRSRRNVRTFSGRAIASSDMDRILEAGRRTPSSMNEQRWDFVVCTDRRQLQSLSEVWRYAKHVATSAATIALVAPSSNDPDTRESVHFDLGQATMRMMLEAADLGVGSCHAAVGDQDLARSILGLPSDWSCPYLLALGYPADRALNPVKRPDRRPFDDVVHQGRW